MKIPEIKPCLDQDIDRAFLQLAGDEDTLRGWPDGPLRFVQLQVLGSPPAIAWTEYLNESGNLRKPKEGEWTESALKESNGVCFFFLQYPDGVKVLAIRAEDRLYIMLKPDEAAAACGVTVASGAIAPGKGDRPNQS